MVSCRLSFNQKENEKYMESRAIIDEFEAEIDCGKIKGESLGIIFSDTISRDTVKGYAEFVVTFDNIDSLNIESVELRRIFLRTPQKIIIRKEDNRFKYYDDILPQLFKSYKCWKKEGETRKLFLNEQLIYILFTIIPTAR